MKREEEGCIYRKRRWKVRRTIIKKEGEKDSVSYAEEEKTYSWMPCVRKG
jgi:hypothetical protein